MHPQMSDLRAANAMRAHAYEGARAAGGRERRTARFGERLLRIRLADLVVSIRVRWERQAESGAA